MKLLICGSRTIAKPQYMFHVLDTYAPYLAGALDLVIEGGATGADRFGAQWAKVRNIPSTRVPADWKRHGKSAGPMRNQLMLSMLTPEPDLSGYTDSIIAFVDKPLKDSRGTAHMTSIAKSAGFEVHVFDLSKNIKVS